jgi:hypothetical protein
MSNPYLDTTQRLDLLTGRAVDTAADAVAFLLSESFRGHITDGALIAKLSSLLADVTAEQDQRRRIARQ